MYSSHRRELQAGGGSKRAPWLVALLTALAAIAVAAAAASAASTVPRAPADLGAPNHDLKVEPPTIIYTGDGTGFLGGASARRPSSIHWTKWTAKVALATGFNQLNNCEPSCAGGAYHGYRVSIELWRHRTLHDALVFTRMTIFYASSRPAGEPRHYTFTDMYVRPGGFGWGPPSASYCAQTNGLTAPAGCENIHSLP